jgi:hypothetical protein
MIIYKIKSEATSLPQEIQVRKLSGNLYEFIGNHNITPKLKIQDGEEVTVYESELTHITASITHRHEMVSALIRLRYTQDAEFAVINKGIANTQDEEYLAYRSYVELCKEQSNTYYSN